MNSLSAETKNQWLLHNGFASDFERRLQKGESDFDLQPPESLHLVLSFLEQATTQGSIAAPLLLTFDDWPLYLGTEMELFVRVRASAGEARSVKDAPCQVFEKNETSLALALFALSVSFKWKSNIYAGGSGLVIHNWEGDYLECYSYPTESFEKFKVLADQFGFMQETQG